MAQTWNPEVYGRAGAFVHQLAGGVVEWLAVQPNEHILDLGCGDGQLTLRLAQTGAQVCGIDASPEMAAAARGRGADAEVGNAEALPYRDHTFDAVFSNAALHWVRNQDAMLREVHRVLKPGGRFVAEMGGHGNVAAIRVAFIAVLDRYRLAGREDGVNYYPTPEGYRQRLERHGFRVERITLIPRPTLLGEGGIANWLRLFRKGVLDTLPEAMQKTVVDDTEALLAAALRDEEGNWVADYVRLRFVAIA